jgi:hypothetical protein
VSIATLWSRLAEIGDDRIAHRPSERVNSRITCFAFCDAHLHRTPIKVIERESGDLVRTQAIGCE